MTRPPPASTAARTLSAHSRQSPPSIVPPRWTSWPPMSARSSRRNTTWPRLAAALAAARPAGPAPTTSRSQRALNCGLSAGGRLSGSMMSEARHGADRRLERLPARPEEGLVVEARRHEGGELVDQRGAIVSGGRQGVDRAHGEIVLERFRGGAEVRRRASRTRHVDDRVRLLGPGAPDSARPVIFEAAADDADAVGEQRRGDAVALRTREEACRRR